MADPDPAQPAGGPRARLAKADTAFRTISEVADDLHIPQHVLRFWETKFAQVRPLKRGGGRRYYRPDDILLLRRISDLLYRQGYTIKGVQRLMREGGGRLGEDIPPPDKAERIAAANEQTRVARPGSGSGLGLGSGADDHAPELPLAGLLRLGPALRPTLAGLARGRGEEAELERLRGLLGRVLLDLESLRASLP